MNKTAIEWTHRPGTIGMTWNPIHFKRDDGGSTKTGNMCTRISPGCTHCYASTINERWGNRLEYTVENLSKGHFYLDEKELQAPLRAKKPCTIFVGDMFDLFHEAIPDGEVARVFSMANRCKLHTFQFLTKRAERLANWSHGVTHYPDADRSQERMPGWAPNCWLGVSVESQKYADERIPQLLQTPAAVRFLSVEPQLEAVDITKYLATGLIHLVIDGGESGLHARAFNLAWAEFLREQCKSAGVAFFMKQVGSRPVVEGFHFVSHPEPGDRGPAQFNVGPIRDRKGGDPSEWPESLRVREFPQQRTAP
jgi:protein gp37